MTIEMAAIGVDLGATKIASALVSAHGDVLAARQTQTQSVEGSEAVLDRLAAEIEALIFEARCPVAGVGIGSPGVVDPVNGIVRGAVNLNWDEVHLVAGLQARLTGELPIFVQKDTNASALGELFFGAGQGCQDFVYLSIGSGLGGGVIANGQLVIGANGIAAELGHLSLDPEGPPCICGLRGCAELTVSGPGMVNLARQRLNSGARIGEICDPDELTPAGILEAAGRGDAAALSVLARAGSDLGAVMAACTAVLNPQRYVIGGGLGLAAFDYIVPAARRELERRVTPAGMRRLEIVPSLLPSSAVGAACLVWQSKGVEKCVEY